MITPLRIPKVFFDDHYGRALDTPAIVRATKAHYYIDAADPFIPELRSDAEFYCHPFGPDAYYLGGLKASARALLKALSKNTLSKV